MDDLCIERPLESSCESDKPTLSDIRSSSADSGYSVCTLSYCCVAKSCLDCACHPQRGGKRGRRRRKEREVEGGR